jgi:hypothetical protein
MPEQRNAATPFRGLAAFFRQQRTDLTGRWMKAVSQDEQLGGADRLTYAQLEDDLPEILDAICVALEAAELDQATPAMGQDARRHGNVRWRQGYRIDELVRELDLFGQVLVDALDEYAGLDPGFGARHASRARRMIDEARSFVAMVSIREVVLERDRRIDDYTGRLKHANHELERRQRLVSELYESRMHITRSVVHDLRNFLNAFSIALQLISRAPARMDTSVAFATRQAEDMKQLVDQMVEYSVVLGDAAPLVPESVNLRDLFDELVTTCQPLVEAKGLKFAATCEPAIVSVQSNRLRLKQVATNLLSNALKYTREGTIHFAIGVTGSDGWFLRVSDTGVGIAPADQARVFEEFERAADSGIPGEGLGLAIVRELCRMLNGTIRFESREGRGTSFEITFPLSLKDPGTSEANQGGTDA